MEVFPPDAPLRIIAWQFYKQPNGIFPKGASETDVHLTEATPETNMVALMILSSHIMNITANTGDDSMPAAAKSIKIAADIPTPSELKAILAQIRMGFDRPLPENP